jgi:hypothetical protein
LTCSVTAISIRGASVVAFFCAAYVAVAATIDRNEGARRAIATIAKGSISIIAVLSGVKDTVLTAPELNLAHVVASIPVREVAVVAGLTATKISVSTTKD